MTHPVTTLNPAGLHNPTRFGYSHTARLSPGAELVFVAGQYGSDPNGAVVSPEFSAQVERAFHNLGLALAAHGLDLSHVAQLRTYVVGLNFDTLGALGAHMHRVWGDAPPAHTVLGVAALAMPDIAFEVEAVAARGA